jgi:SET domain-containing protein
MSKARIEVRDSAIHGRGVVALTPIAKGKKIIEYTGERISWDEADRRPPSDPDDPNHTFFFSLSDGATVIDAAVGGNDARWINHSCKPNCEAIETDDGRVFIHARRELEQGEELNYDYGLILEERITKKLRKAYECRCGAKKCRGTMLAIEKESPAAKARHKKTDKSDKKSEKKDAKKRKKKD